MAIKYINDTINISAGPQISWTLERFYSNIINLLSDLQMRVTFKGSKHQRKNQNAVSVIVQLVFWLDLDFDVYIKAKNSKHKSESSSVLQPHADLFHLHLSPPNPVTVS